MAALIIPDETISRLPLARPCLHHWLRDAHSGCDTQPHTAPPHCGEPLLHKKDVPGSQIGHRPPKKMEVRESRMEIRACTEIFQSGVKLAFGSSPPSAILGFHVCQFSLQME